MAPLGGGTSTLTYTYYAAGRRTQMQVTGQTAVTYGYDDAHRITGITQGTNVVGFTYDAASRRTMATLPNGVTIDYAYDNANQLTGLTYKRNGVTLGDLTYGYDAAGRRTSMGGSYARVNLPPALTSATYDAANKLTNWAGTAQTYDLNGNLTGDGTRTYTWDTRDRLTATSGGGQTSSCVYDAVSRRISRTISGTQTAYVHDGHNPVHTGTGSTITGTLLNGGGLDERYGRTVGGANTALLTDALGSLLHIVDAAGATTATYTYEPYGAVTSSGTDSTGFQYTGREVDVGGLMYYRARYYNPRTARFISEDPIGLAGGVNLYGYVDGDPITNSDPSGLQRVPSGTYIQRGDVPPSPQQIMQRKVDQTSTLNAMASHPNGSNRLPGEYVGVNFPWSLDGLKRYCRSCIPKDLLKPADQCQAPRFPHWREESVSDPRSTPACDCHWVFMQ